MTPKFSTDQTLFNHDTKEQGTVGRVYESNGITMYEVRVSVDPQGCSIGSNVSDWAEEVLEVVQGRSPLGNSPFVENKQRSRPAR